MARLAGKIAVVTGSGGGIGLAIAELFAAEGAHVYVVDIDGAAAEAAAARILASLKAAGDAGGTATALTIDVTRGQDVTHLMRTLQTRHGKADVVVNNAGINVRADFRHLTDEEWVRLREVNLDGVVRIARDAFPLLKAAGQGSLINVASIMGHRGLRQLAGYSATKGAVAALTRGLAVEYAAFGIRVNTLSPGFVETAMTERILRTPPIRKALLEQTPMRRFGTGEDIARAALFLASDESTFVTGSELLVDGGMAAGL